MEFATFCKRVGANVRLARWLKGWTQEQLAAGNLSYRFLQEIERGERNPSAETLFILARALGVAVADLADVDGMPGSSVPLRKRKATPPPRGRKAKALTARRT